MTFGFYLDEHIARPVADALRDQNCEVVLAVDVEMVGKEDDDEHLPFATSQSLVMVTFDRGFAGRTMSRSDHAGLICFSEKIRFDIGRQIRILIDFSARHSLEDTKGQVFWLK